MHRGVGEGYPGYEDATQGRAYPLGGDATPAEHNAGNTNSEYTAWTTTWSVAESAAMGTYYGTTGCGVVMTARIPMSRIVKSPDTSEEDEVFVKGAVTGASVRYVPGNSDDDYPIGDDEW